MPSACAVHPLPLAETPGPGLAPRSRRPRRVRKAQWSPQLAAAREARADFPMWGKARIAVLLRRQGYAAGESTLGRILKKLVERGTVASVPALRRKAPRSSLKRNRPHAKGLPKGRKPTAPGEIVQVDTLSQGHGRPALKHFTACDPIAKWTCAQTYRRATARNAKRFLDKLQNHMPFPIRAIQVDGGSEFKAGFERECHKRGIDLFELLPGSPELNGCIERNNGAWRYEFYATWDLDPDGTNRWTDAFADEFNTFRPHDALDGQTSAEYLLSLTAEETRPSHVY